MKFSSTRLLSASSESKQDDLPLELPELGSRSMGDMLVAVVPASEKEEPRWPFTMVARLSDTL